MYAGFHVFEGQLFPAFGGLIPVRTARDFEFLLWESEVMQPGRGRIFLITGADRLSYRVHRRDSTYWVQRLKVAEAPAPVLVLTPHELFIHCIGAALREGFLFAPLLDA